MTRQMKSYCPYPVCLLISGKATIGWRVFTLWSPRPTLSILKSCRPRIVPIPISIMEWLLCRRALPGLSITWLIIPSGIIATPVPTIRWWSFGVTGVTIISLPKITTSAISPHHLAHANGRIQESCWTKNQASARCVKPCPPPPPRKKSPLKGHLLPNYCLLIPNYSFWPSTSLLNISGAFINDNNGFIPMFGASKKGFHSYMLQKDCVRLWKPIQTDGQIPLQKYLQPLIQLLTNGMEFLPSSHQGIPRSNLGASSALSCV